MTARRLLPAAGVLTLLAACGSSTPTTRVATPSTSLPPVTAGPIAATPSGRAGVVRSVPGTGTQAVTLAIGDVLRVSTAPGDTAAVTDPAVLGTDGPAYRALAAGTTTVSVEHRPTCSPGGLCSDLVQLVGTVTVTVTG